MAERAHRAKYEAECDRTNEKRDSDLCAQWKAADAATDAARWTYFGNWIGGISGLLVLVAIGFAFEANHIARRTAKRQLRAYLTICDANVAAPEVENKFSGRMWVKNSGQTPAKYVTWHTTLEVRNAGEIRPFNLIPLAEPPSSSTIGAGGTTFNVFESARPLTQELVDRITQNELIVWVHGTIDYVDVFDEKHRLSFRYFYDLPVRALCAAPDGNDGD